MRRMHRVVLLVGLVALAPVLAGCESFDMDKLDIFGLNEKKKLPGDRKAVFPEGVPGVTQGIPPEYRQGYQPPDAAQPAAENEAAAEAAKKTAAVEPEPKPKPKRKPKPRPVQPAAQDQQQPQQQQAQPPAQGQAGAPWPSSPPTGTFSR